VNFFIHTLNTNSAMLKKQSIQKQLYFMKTTLIICTRLGQL